MFMISIQFDDLRYLPKHPKCLKSLEKYQLRIDLSLLNQIMMQLSQQYIETDIKDNVTQYSFNVSQGLK